ncbi:GDSL esterase/lipase At1g09390-like [Prunus avium]|uniref:GDSL esterase/lipase At1g09390-like n=1 Tax=Prunus avium TaxID=42229 RepID=A0A6P5S6X1_PRUAV|nr:GDSL esterase/lipase At1g09390-like [Prunus avium]
MNECKGFRSALYTIDTGQNDLAESFFYLPQAQVIQRIPSFIAEIKAAILSLHQHGGKYFWVHNTGPLGCLPQKLAGNVDNHDCLKFLNDAAKAFNKQFHTLCEELRSQMRRAIIAYVDIYAIKYDLIANSAKYGSIPISILRAANRVPTFAAEDQSS